MLPRLGLRNEDDETLYAGDTVASATGLFDVNFVFFALFNGFAE